MGHTSISIQQVNQTTYSGYNQKKAQQRQHRCREYLQLKCSNCNQNFMRYARDINLEIVQPRTNKRKSIDEATYHVYILLGLQPKKF